MCGRVQLDLEIDAAAMRRLRELLQQQFPEIAMASGEKYPSDLLPVLTAGQDKPALRLMRWGFPMRHSSKLVINARFESAAEKPMFREALALRRCVLPCSGFYEWSHDSAKTKYLFRLPGASLLYLAGLYNADQEQPRFVVLTQAAGSSMLDIHDRMPVILRQNEVAAWLNNAAQAAAILSRTGPELVRTAQ